MKPQLLALALALGTPVAAMAQVTVFNDDFTSGSDTFNTAATAPTYGYTSWEVAATKATTTTLTSGNLTMGLTAATSSGLAEIQAQFTTSPLTLSTAGDYVDMKVKFKDTAKLIAAGASSYLYAGLYNSGGVAPLSSLAAGGLTSTAGSAYATGGTQLWQGYLNRIAGNTSGAAGSSGFYSRPQQTGAGTTSGNQDLVGNNVSNGSTYNNPTGSQIGSSQASVVNLTEGSIYTWDYKITLDATGNVILNSTLLDSGGNTLFTQTGTSTTSKLVGTTFDSLAVGFRTSSGSYAPAIDLNQVTVISQIAAIPEPASLALIGSALTFLAIFRRRR